MNILLALALFSAPAIVGALVLIASLLARRAEDHADDMRAAMSEGGSVSSAA